MTEADYIYNHSLILHSFLLFIFEIIIIIDNLWIITISVHLVVHVLNTVLKGHSQVVFRSSYIVLFKNVCSVTV